MTNGAKRIRPVIEPLIIAGVIIANIHWNAINAISGIFALSITLFSVPVSPILLRLPMIPSTSLPKINGYPISINSTEITPIKKKLCIIVLSTFLLRSIPP